MIIIVIHYVYVYVYVYDNMHTYVCIYIYVQLYNYRTQNKHTVAIHAKININKTPRVQGNPTRSAIAKGPCEVFLP